MILVTGVTGFIGGHLLDALILEYGKSSIVALTSKPTSKCKYLLHNDYNFNKDYFVKSGFKDIDTIIHAGAFTPKSGAEANYIEDSNSNITNTERLLISNLPKLKNFIFFSTLDVYGYSNPITEETLLLPTSLYGHSKAYCEHLISAWAVQNKICHQILRIGHVYGDGEEKYQKIIPITMQRLLKKKPIQIFGNGNEIRSFIYISDVIKAINKSIKLDNYAGVINIVGEEKISIAELINKIITISGITSPEKIYSETDRKPRDLVFNNLKMKEILCKPKVNLEQGLINEWEYMKNLVR